LWLLGVTAAVFITLSVLPRFPHRLNYLVKITADNAEHQYRLAVEFLRDFRLQEVLIFWVIVSGVERHALRPWLLYILLGSVAGRSLWYVRLSLKNK
jgi:hypothetical protein